MNANRATGVRAIAICSALWTHCALAIDRAVPHLDPAAAAGECGSGWRWANPRPQGNNLRAVVWTGAQFVSAGDRGTVLTSPDGVEWTPRAFGSGGWITCLTQAGTRVVAISGDTVGISEDGISWDLHSPGPSYVNAAVWTGEQLVAVGGGYSAQGCYGYWPCDYTYFTTILTSADGVVWARQSAPAGFTATLAGIAWTGAQVVAVGEGSALTSPDGITWTKHDVPGATHLSSVAWTGSQLVAADGPQLYTSNDGNAWTLHALQPGVTLSILSWTGTELVGLSSEAGVIYSSSNGTDWTRHATGSAGQFLSVASSGPELVAVGTLGSIETSGDGDEWTSRSYSATNDVLNAATWTGSQFVAVGTAIATSSDGFTWTSHSAGGNFLNRVVWTGTQLVVVGWGGAIMTSPDGARWTSRQSGTTESLTGLTWTGTQLVAVGSSFDGYSFHGVILTSPDGIVWTQRDPGGPGQLSSITWTGSRLVAVGGMGPMPTASGMACDSISQTKIVTSPDGTAWTDRAGALCVGLNAVTWTGTRLVAVGTEVVTSPDGVTWASETFGGDGFDFADVTWTGRQLVALEFPYVNPRIVSSDSGTALWESESRTVESSFTWPTLHGVAGNPSQIVAVGEGGTILVNGCAGCSAPQVTLEPQNVTVAPGGEATLTVTADGTGPLGYQWYMGRAGDTTFPVGTNSSTFSSTLLAGAASYWVRISNACGHVDSDAASITAGWAVRRHVRIS